MPCPCANKLKKNKSTAITPSPAPNTLNAREETYPKPLAVVTQPQRRKRVFLDLWGKPVKQ